MVDMAQPSKTWTIVRQRKVTRCKQDQMRQRNLVGRVWTFWLGCGTDTVLVCNSSKITVGLGWSLRMLPHVGRLFSVTLLAVATLESSTVWDVGRTVSNDAHINGRGGNWQQSVFSSMSLS